MFSASIDNKVVVYDYPSVNFDEESFKTSFKKICERHFLKNPILSIWALFSQSRPSRNGV